MIIPKKETLRILEKELLIMVTQFERDGYLMTRYFRRANTQKLKLETTEIKYKVPPCHLDRPYSGWINGCRMKDEAEEWAKGLTALKDGRRLGMTVPIDAGEDWLSKTSVPSDVTTSIMRWPETWVAAKIGTLEDYWPFEAMQQLMDQLTPFYPQSAFLTTWHQQGPEFEKRWKSRSLVTWMCLAVRSQFDSEKDELHELWQFILQLIEGAPLERLL